jgi:hypothetical protein
VTFGVRAKHHGVGIAQPRISRADSHLATASRASNKVDDCVAIRNVTCWRNDGKAQIKTIGKFFNAPAIRPCEPVLRELVEVSYFSRKLATQVGKSHSVSEEMSLGPVASSRLGAVALA